MGILNLTPDSFSDGGRFLARDAALRHAEAMVEEGAAIIDIGGESTRPGAQPVSVEQELGRVVPVIEALAGEIPVPISVDTLKPAVMREAVAAGAGLINDVMALQAPGAVETVAELKVPVCLMHMQGEPRTMQQEPHYADVVAEVRDFLADRVAACEAAGIARERLLLDPGFGFGKSLGHNLSLLKHLRRLESLGLPLLVGISRKSMIGTLLGGAPVDQRVNGSVAAAVVAVMQGAAIIRVHDVGQTVDALNVATAVLSAD
jgi:dihydropteroate synthase